MLDCSPTRLVALLLVIYSGVMNNKLVYQFANGQIANRFLNDVNSSRFGDAKAKLFSADDKVVVNYPYTQGGFDTTGADLDDLAARYEGQEVPL